MMQMGVALLCLAMNGQLTEQCCLVDLENRAVACVPNQDPITATLQDTMTLVWLPLP